MPTYHSPCIPSLVLKPRSRWRLVAYFMPPAVLTRKKELPVNTEWETLWVTASVLVLRRRRFVFSCSLKKLRHRVRSVRNCSENFMKDFYRAVRIVSRQGMCVTSMMNSMAVKGLSSTNKTQRKLPVKASISRQDSIATNFSSCCLWGRSDEDVEWNVTFCLRYLMNYRESSFIRNSSAWEPAWIFWTRTCFALFAGTIHQISHINAQYDEYKLSII
jgi:hypothetical protein